MTQKPFKPTISEAALIEWILGDPEKRFAAHYRNSGGIHLCERTTQRSEDGKWEFRRISGTNPSREDQPVVARFGGKLKFDPHNLKVAGLVNIAAAAAQWPDERKAYSEFNEGIHRATPWPYDTAIVTVTPAAAGWWEAKGKTALEKLLTKAAEKKAAAALKERVAVFGCRRHYEAGPYAGEHAGVGRIAEIVGKAQSVLPKWAGIRPAFSAVITRETETRYYLRDVVSLTNAWLRPEGGAGSNVETYIDKKFMILDNATSEDIRRLQDFDADIQRDYAAMRDKAVEEMIPVLANLVDRADQKAAEIDGTFGELLESLRPKRRD